MSKVKTGLIGISSAVISLFVTVLNYISLENCSGVIRLIAIVLSALAIGMCQGFFIQRPRHITVSTGAFFGLLTLWSPVVVATYGFALMALPLIAGFAMLVFFGAGLGTDLRRSICSPA